LLKHDDNLVKAFLADFAAQLVDPRPVYHSQSLPFCAPDDGNIALDVLKTRKRSEKQLAQILSFTRR
jgi:hypothetical protein